MIPIPEGLGRTAVLEVKGAISGVQTVRPDADLLFVAGAGWTKKQSDGQIHLKEAEELIKEFLVANWGVFGEYQVASGLECRRGGHFVVLDAFEPGWPDRFYPTASAWISYVLPRGRTAHSRLAIYKRKEGY